MSELNGKFQEILNSIDATPDLIIDQESVVQEFNKYIPEGHELTIEEKAEGLAFSFADRFTKSNGENYFGPRVSMTAEDGSIYESPSLQHVQPDMIEYWKAKAASSQHPFLIARYAGLAWDLSAVVTGKQPDHNLRKRFIQASVDLVRSKQFKYPTVGIHWLGRALEIASKFNDNEFFEPIKDIALSYEKELNEQEKPGEWGFAYDLLINNKRISLSSVEEKAIIDLLEHKLIVFSSAGNDGKTDPWACEYAASRLAEHYKRKNLPDEVKRVVLTVGKAYEPLFEGSTATQVAGWMQKLHQLYLYHQLNEEAEDLLKRLREVSAEAIKEMGGFEQKFTLPKEETDAMVDSVYSEGAEKAFEQIVFRFIPNKEAAKESIYELAKMAPMQFHFPIQLQDEKGRAVANVGALSKDEDGHIILRISEQLNFSALLLHLVLLKGQENGVLTNQTILDFLSHSPTINKSRFSILSKALQYYFDEDYLGFLHAAIPQIEEAIRNLVEISGGKILRYKEGIYQLRTFDDILRDNTVMSVCGENIQLYLRILFTDPRGWNLRNDICHGLMEFELFNKQTADRVFHALLTLGMIRPAENKEELK
ncbi:MAG: DUF4209 domain-containing protein [Flavobacterium sp.]|nr:MAG: DUF4209 domain-containing protein [Flavobacterium sp.]